MGPISQALGVKVERDRVQGKLKLSQKHYIENVLARFEMSDCKSAPTPLECKLQLDSGGDPCDVPYQELIGALMYLAATTRPDIMYSVSYLSQFSQKPTSEHWKLQKGFCAI